MIAGRRVLGVIPARGGSKGVPGKNLCQVGGKPLIAWTIEAALATECIDRVIVSSDDAAIMAAARSAGADVPFQRPPDLASDESASIDVVLHALDMLAGYDLVVLLQPTSPLRTAADIDAATRLCVSCNSPACVSVSPAEQNPYWMFRVDGSHRLTPVLADQPMASRRQDLPAVYVLNGAIYVAEPAWLRRTRSFVGPEAVGYVMPAGRSIDIDTPEDVLVADRALSRIEHRVG